MDSIVVTAAVLIIVAFVAIRKTWFGSGSRTDGALQESVSEIGPETDTTEDGAVKDSAESGGRTE
ncbi:hypothetical protein [uncultured Bacteroides sp.]|uniref:hypothetical protein n=1 Tax=uncultured Bacteroides sp. TaxID=162156 RepID=UPI002592A436|nr:hypothetical protein [uncultured Bacteroides sp.]